jgi:hypothetical protein
LGLRDTLPVPNDLIVEEQSCLGAGSRQGSLAQPATHFDYPERAATTAALSGLELVEVVIVPAPLLRPNSRR